MKEILSLGSNRFYKAKWQDRSSVQKFSHELIFPKNTYSPWNSDSEFRKVYDVIQAHTLVDVYRCFELWSLAKQAEFKPGVIVEVGVWRGGTGALLAAGSGDKSKLYLCDTFSGVVKATTRDSVYTGGEHSDTSEKIVTDLLTQVGLSNFQILRGIFPDESSASIENIDIKICHIDVDVYQSAKDIFAWVWPKVIAGGVVVFDDYGFAACEGITELVNELASGLDDALFVYNINGHALLIKSN
jgi:O-methyltransferase